MKRGMNMEEILRRMESGLPKLWLVHNALCLRREHPEWFGADAAYTPMLRMDRRATISWDICAANRVAVIVPRWPLKLGGKMGSDNDRTAAGQVEKHAHAGDVAGRPSACADPVAALSRLRC